MNSKNRFILISLLAFEFFLLNAVLILFLYFRLPEFSINDSVFMIKLAKLIMVYNVSWLAVMLYVRGNEFYTNPYHNYFRSIVITLFCFVGFVVSLVILLKIRYFNRSSFIIPIFIFCFLNYFSHKYLFKYLKKRGAHLLSNVLLIGSTNKFSNSSGFKKVMRRYGYNIIGHLENENSRSSNNFKIDDNIENLAAVLTSNTIDEIFISMSALDENKIKKAIKTADSFGVRVKLIPENPMLLAKNYIAGTMGGGLAIFKLRQSKLDSFKHTIVKRLFDFCFALMVVIVFFPVYLIVAFLVRIESKGPVFYCPDREGEGGKTFKCYKFRTMFVSNDPLNGTKSTIKNDPRITRIGKILRKTDLDEMPQFFNVLKGEMSVIGPRPHRVNLQRDLRKSVNNYMVRSYVKPGITGWAQVNGWRGPTVTDEEKNERIKHDLWYIENWSFWLDLKIIFLTLFGGHHKKAF